MMSTIPPAFAGVSPSPRNSVPITAMAAVPTPAQIAYAVPTDTVLRVCASSAKATTYPRTVVRDGHSLLKPSVYFIAVVAPTSAAMAPASSTYPMRTTVHMDRTGCVQVYASGVRRVRCMDPVYAMGTMRPSSYRSRSQGGRSRTDSRRHVEREGHVGQFRVGTVRAVGA